MAPKTKGPASSSDSGTTYQVFLSFRGPDTRQGFADVLYHALTNVGIYVFRDNEEIRKGEEIGDEILRAIDQSRVFVPIFSKGYAGSKWCLIELAKMFESMREASCGNKKKILPIFYDVSVDDVKLKTKMYAGALTEHRKTKKFSTDTVRQWKEALCGAGKIRGYELKDQGYGEFAKSFVKEVSLNLKVKHTLVTDYLVPRDDQVEALMKLLDIDSPGVRFVGIHGMGGIGKTTLARVVFNKLCDLFDQSCFLADVRESSSHHKGIEKLQEQLFESAGLKLGEIKHKDDGIMRIRETFPHKKLLLVLDDIGHNEQMQYLAGDPSWFGSGSRIIISTRDQSLFSGDVQILEVESMKSEEALRLFSMHAFDQDSPPSDYLILSEEAVASTGRLPLALEVIGSQLRHKPDRDWVKMISRLKKEPHKDVWDKLMISYEVLDDKQKQIFLDIACFFIGCDKTYPMYMWEACRFDPEEGLEELIHMSLVKIEEEFVGGVKHEKLRMHDQLRDMGRKIAGRSRLWRRDEALEVVQRKEGNEDIEMLLLLHNKSLVELSVSGLYLPKLRYLECQTWIKGLVIKGLLPSLRWLSLRYCSLAGLATSLCLRNLAVLELFDCGFTEDWEGWSQIGGAICLRVLDLGGSDVRQLPPKLPMGLAYLRLSNSKITELSGDIISRLKYLRAIDISFTPIRELPTSLGMLKRLEELRAVGCSSLKEIPPSIEGCTCLRVLDVRRSGVRQLPPNLPVSLTDLHTSGSVVQFSLSPTSALIIQLGDITKWSVDGSSDAIVNSANERMLGGGGADGAIHEAAGPELAQACRDVPEVRPGIRCPTGEARITPGFKLPVSHVIHTVGPIYYLDENPKPLLRSAYKNSLAVAKESNIQYIAFPAISCGVYRYPYDEAAEVAISTVKEFSDGVKEVHFVLFFDGIYNVWSSKARELLQQ